jgi:molecular chaperone DnaJ
MATDFYALLGVPRSATEEEIKRAYRRLARELHPDANGGDPTAEERFKEVTLAYETLRDPERRRRYDLFGPEGVRGTGSGGAPGSGPGSGDFFGAGGLGDLFDTFFGAGPFGGTARRRGPAGPPPGADLEVTLELDFEEAVFGTQREVKVRGPVVCETCNGSGSRPGTTPIRCRECGGSGEVRHVRQSILGQIVTASPCVRCGGQGEEITSPCDTCRGEGRRFSERVQSVEVPAGVEHGTRLRMSGRGAAGARGGLSGDLYIHLRVRPHERFERQGDDLIEVLHLPVTQAALGSHLSYETLDGVEDLVIPAGTQTGRIFRLRGRGVPNVNGRGRGDLLVQVVVDTPDDLDGEQQELLRRLATVRGEEVAPPDTGFFARIRSAFK